MQQIPILAIHGSASSGAMWKVFKRRYAPHSEILTPDLPGYGNQFGYVFCQPPCLAQRAFPLLQHIKRQQGVHLVAHSFGSSVALEIVRQAPDCVRSLTLYEPVVPAIFKQCEDPEDVRWLGDLVGLSQILAGTSAPVAMQTFIDFWHHPGAWVAFSPTVQDKLAQLAPVVLRDFQEAMTEPAATYADIPFTQPVKIFVGQHTQPHARRMAQLLQQGLPQAQCQVMASMGHMGPLTHAEVVSQAIWQHIQRAEQTALAA